MYTPEYAGSSFRSLNHAHPLARRLILSGSGTNINRWTSQAIYVITPDDPYPAPLRKTFISSPIKKGLPNYYLPWVHRKGGGLIVFDQFCQWVRRYPSFGYSDQVFNFPVNQPPNALPSNGVATTRIYVQIYLVFSGRNAYCYFGLAEPDKYLLGIRTLLNSSSDYYYVIVNGNIVAGGNFSGGLPPVTPQDKRVLVLTFLLDPVQNGNQKNYRISMHVYPSNVAGNEPNLVFSTDGTINRDADSYPDRLLLNGGANFYSGYSIAQYPFYHGLLVLDHSNRFSSFAEAELFSRVSVVRELLQRSGKDLWLMPSELIPGIFTYEASGYPATISNTLGNIFDPYQGFATAATAEEAQIIGKLTIRGSGAATTYSLGQFYNLLLSTLLYSNPQTLSIANVEAAPIYIAGILGQTNTESRLPMTVLIRPSGLLTTQTQVLATNSVWLKSAIIGYTETVAFYGNFGRGQDIYLTTGTGAAISSFSKLYDRLGGDAESETTSLFISRVYLTPAIQAETLSAADIYQSQIILSYFAGRTTTSLEARISPAFGYLTAFGGPRSSSSVNLEPSQIIQSTGTLQSSTESRLGTGVYVVSSHLLAAHESVFLPYFPSLCIVSAFPVTLTLGEQQYRLTERLSGAAETATVSLPITEGISGIAVQAETGGILTESYVTVNLIQYPGLGWYKDQTVTQIII